MHHDHRPTGRRAVGTVLWATLALNAGLLVAEAVGGVAFHSLALLSDAVHQSSDVVALVVALVARGLSARPESARRTYGWRRAEALGAQVNACLLLAAAVWIFIEAGQRLGTPESIDGAGVVALASVALAVNVASAGLLARVRGRDLNLHGVFLHMAADAAGSLGAIAAGVAVLAFGATWVDPVASIGIGVLIVVAGIGLLRDATNVLLEGVPRDLDPAALEQALADQPGVQAVHHLHVWELGSDLAALSVHVVLTGEPTLHEAQGRGDRLRAMLLDRFGVEHATLELECHDCATDEAHDPVPGPSRGDSSVRP